MDIESRLQRVETDVRRTRTYVRILLVIVLVPIGLARVGVSDPKECLVSVLVVWALMAVAHLLVTATSGLRRFATRREADAQLQERILREFIAERAKPQGQAPNP